MCFPPQAGRVEQRSDPRVAYAERHRLHFGALRLSVEAAHECGGGENRQISTQAKKVLIARHEERATFDREGEEVIVVWVRRTDRKRPGGLLSVCAAG